MAHNKQQIAKKAKTDVSTDVIDMAADAGKGLEGADKDSYAIPFLAILQGLSPQIGVVKGATPGMFINTITEELFDEVLIIPCAFQRRFLRWSPRDEGGGFKGSFLPLEVEGDKLEGLTKNDIGQPMIGNDILRDTRIHYVLLQDKNGSWKPAVLSLSSTQIKKSKRLMSLIQGLELKRPDDPEKTYNPASFSHMYRLTTVKEENAKGKWWGLAIELEGVLTSSALYNSARKFCEEVNAGMVTTAEPQDEEGKGAF